MSEFKPGQPVWAVVARYGQPGDRAGIIVDWMPGTIERTGTLGMIVSVDGVGLRDVQIAFLRPRDPSRNGDDKPKE